MNKKNRSHALKAVVLQFVALFLVCTQSESQTLRHPQPGEVFKDHRLVNRGNTWRVTDQNAKAKDPKAQIPNTIYGMQVDDLQEAVRAELIIDYWGGHIGTDLRQIRFNGNEWMDLPDIFTGTPKPNCFLQAVNFVMDIPVSHLAQGTNTLEGLSGGQVCYNYDWGMWGMYGVILRVYYDPEIKPHPTGGITSPASGDSFTDRPYISVGASSSVGVAEVDFYAFFNGYDPDGDGVFADWQVSYQAGARRSEHIGTDKFPPFGRRWNTNLVPDQPTAGVKLIAHIRDINGYTFVTDEVNDLTLERTETSVRIYRSGGVGEKFWVRDHEAYSTYITIPQNDDLSTIESAFLLVRSWNALQEETTTTVNSWVSPLFGKDHRYDYNKIGMDDGSALVNGMNTFTVESSEEEEHGTEIMWPGPAIIVRYNMPPRMQNSYPALFGFDEEEGDEVHDLTVNGNDGVIYGNAVRTGSGRYGEGIEFDGISGHVDLDVIDFPGSSLTVSMWAFVDSNSAPDSRLFAKAIGTSATEGHLIVSLNNTNGIRYRLSTDTGVTDVISHGTLALDAWNHIAVTYDGSSMRIYVNGVPGRAGSKRGKIYNGSNVPVWVGDNPGGTRRPFKGRIDELRIYSIAQTPAQIAADMATAVVNSDLTSPTIPPNVVAVLDSKTSSTLRWDPSTDAVGVTGYRVFRDGVHLIDTPSTAYADEFLYPNRTYDYTVTAIDLQGNESAHSIVSSVTTPPDLQPPTTPQNLSANSSAFSVNLKWTSSIDDTGIAFYRIYRNGTEVGNSSTAFHNDTGLKVNTTYVYQVMAVDFIGNFSGLSNQVVSTTLSEPANPTLLLGLPFEELDGDYTLDSSGYRYDGLLTTGAEQSDSGKIGKSIKLSGGNGFVDLGKLDIPGSELTIAAWIRADDFGVRDARIISKATGSGDNQHYWMLSTLSTPDGMRVRARLKTTSGATKTLVGETTLLAKTWTHVALTYDGEFMKIYLDGVLDGELEQTGEVTQNSTVSAAVGDQPQGGRNFDGFIDEVRIHIVALDNEGILRIMNEQLPGAGGSNIGPSIAEIEDQVIYGDSVTDTLSFQISDVGTAPEDLLVSATSSNAALVPNGNIVLGGSSAIRTIVVTPAIGLTGSAMITVRVDDGEAIAAESFSVTAVTPGNMAPLITPIDDILISEGETLGTIAFSISDSETPATALGVSVKSDNPQLVSADRITLEGTAGTRTISIAPIEGQTGTAEITITVNDSEFFIEEKFVVEVSPPFGTNLWLGLPFEEEFGDFAFDVSGNQGAGVLTGGVGRVAEGKLGRAVVFPGNGESIELGKIDIPGSEMTIAAWINPNDFSLQGERIISKATGELEGQHFWMLSTHTVNEGTKLRMRLKTTSGGTRTLLGASNLVTADWTHVAATYDGSEMKLYINGILDASLPANGLIAQNSTVPVTVGDQPQGGRNFHGMIDELRIYKQALKEPELKTIMTEFLDPPNARPFVSEIPDQSVYINESSDVLEFTVADAETAPYLLVLTASSDNPSLIANTGITIGGAGNNRTIKLSPLPGRTGNALITLTVSDGEYITEETFSLIVVTPGNTLPTIGEIYDIQIVPDSSTGPIPFKVDDALTSPASLIVTATSDSPELVSSQGIFMGGSGNDRTISITPTPGQTGSAIITVTVDDGEYFVSEYFVISVVTPVNPDLRLGMLFEEGIGETVLDFSNYDNNGTLTSGVARAESAERGGALLFSGNGGHVNLGNFDIPGEELTISAWIRPDDFGVQDARIISKATGLTDNQHFWMLSTIKTEEGTKLRMRLRTTDGVSSALIGNVTIPVGAWTHVSGTYDGATLRIYINGVFDTELAWSGLISQNPDVPAAIGDQPQGGKNFDGLIDEVRIYTRALPAEEISLIMDGFLAVPNSEPRISAIEDRNVLVNASTGKIAFSITDAQTSQFLLGLSAVSDNADLIPPSGLVLSNDGRVQSIEVNPAQNVTGSALITVSVSDGEFTVTEEFTVTVVTPGNTPPAITAIDDLEIIPGAPTGPIAFRVSDSETLSGELAVSASSDNPDLFPQGQIIFTGTGGDRTVALTPRLGLKGEADVTVLVSDGELTSQEKFTVRVVPPVHPDLLLGFQFEEDSGTDAFDSSGNENHGSFASGVTRSINGFEGDALAFNGVTGRLDIGGFDIPGSEMTLAVWIKPDDFGVEDARLISKASGTSDNAHYWMLSTVASEVVDGEDEIRLRMRLKTSSGDTQTVIGGTNLRNLDGWIHIAGTYDGSSIKTYINGVEDASAAWDGAIIQDPRVPVSIGDQPQGDQAFDGLMDNVQIYTAAFSATEIQALIAGTLDVPNTPPSINEIEDQHVFRDGTTGSIGFKIDDIETTPYLLSVSATADNKSLVPDGGISIVGTGRNRSLVISPSTGVTGLATVTVTVSDGQYTNTEDFILRVVTPGNTPPTISSIGNKLIEFGSSSGEISFIVGDAHTNPAELTLTAQSDNPVLVPVSGIVFGGVGSVRTVNVTPNSIQGATAIVTITVGDGELFSDQSFEVTVNPPFDSSLLLGLPFEEDSGSTAYDISPNLNNGSLTPGAKRSLKGKYGRAIEFTGQGGQINLNNLDIPGSALTIAVWIKPDDFGIQDARLISKANGKLINDHYWMLSTNSVNGSDKLRMRLKTGNGVTRTLVGTSTLPVGEWTHIAATYNGSLLRLYVNGALDASLQLSGKIVQNPGVQAGIGDQPDGEHNFDGLMDDFRIYSQALAEIELQGIMNEPLVNVGTINLPPELSSIKDRNLFSDQTTGELAFSINDEETDPSLLTVTVSSDNASLLPQSSLVLAGAGSSRSLSITPAASKSGSSVVTVSVSDGNTTVRSSFTLTVKKPLEGSGWWDPSWDYRTLITVDANGSARNDTVVDVPVDLTAVLASRGLVASVDDSTLRVVEVDANGNFLDDKVPFQFDRVPDYSPDTKASGTLVIRLTGITPVGTSRRYQLYFSTPGSGASAFAVPSEVDVADDIVDEGQASYRVATPTSTLFYHKMGAGFSSWVDKDGNDWIDYHATGGASGNYRGIPNMVYPEGHFHPGETSATSSLLSSGPLKATIHSETLDGKWECTWEIYRDFARMTVLKAGHNFWFLYEGTPGGILDAGTDLVVRSDGAVFTAAEEWSDDIEGDEWTYFADPDVGRSLFFAMHETDSGIDGYRDFNGQMTVFAFGRKKLEVNPFLGGTPKHFTVGLVDQVSYEPMAAAINSTYKDSLVTVEGLTLRSESNNRPIVTIGSPTGVTVIDEGQNVSFSASAADLEDGSLNAAIRWSSDLDGSIPGAGVSMSTTSLSVGTHEVRASATDSGGLVGHKEVKVVVNPNTPPAVTITQPLDGSFFFKGDPVTFTGYADDIQDGDVTSTLTWSSSIDGGNSAGSSVSTSALSEGVHTIIAKARDSRGLEGTSTITLTIGASSSPPFIAISEPVDGAQYNVGDSVTFNASATDPEDGDISAGITWRSSLDGLLPTFGGSISTSSLTVGVHTISATAIDSGFFPSTDTAVITVRSPSQVPTVSILEPQDGSLHTNGGQIRLSATASDPEDGNLTGALKWSSNIDGNLGVGGTLIISNLSVGVHTLTATAADSGFQSGSASLSITVADSTMAPAVSIIEPINGSFVREGDTVRLIASAIDAEDGNLTAAITWASSLDGPIAGVGGDLSVANLSVGLHTIRATVIDSGLQPGSASAILAIGNDSDAPVVKILAPFDGATFNHRGTVDFVAQANDIEDGDISNAVTWHSDIDGELSATGSSISTASLSVGTHTITARAVDSGFVPGFDSLTITVRALSSVPVVTIETPAEDSLVQSGAAVSFKATANDFEDGDLSPSIVWRSSIDGVISSSGGLATVSNLSVGRHIVTATAKDSGLLEGSKSVILSVQSPSSPPAVTITAPAGGSFFAVGDQISFAATAIDPEDGDISTSIKWSSNIDGNIEGIGNAISVEGLSVGIHTITATATDGGYTPGSASITVAVSTSSNAPVVSISGPDRGSVYNQGDLINLSATASDADDGDVTASITWSSSLDGSIVGSGGLVSTSTLSVGEHELTASAVDSGFLPGFARLRVTVRGISAAPVVAIVAPGSSLTYEQGTNIEFSATAIDAEDGDISSLITWSSNIDGPFRESGALVANPTLTPGTHTITATVLDSGLLPGSATRTVTISPLIGQFVSDDFSEEGLDTELWTIVDPVGDGVVEVDGGALTISLPEGEDHDIWFGGNRTTRVMQQVNDTNFELEVKFNSEAPQQYAMQGILIEQDADNYLRFDFVRFPGSLRLFSASFIGPVPTTQIAKNVSFGDAYYLKVNRNGHRWTLSYSYDGKAWKVGGRYYYPLTVRSAGIFAGNASGAASPAFKLQADYIFNTAVPIYYQDAELDVVVSGEGTVNVSPEKDYYKAGETVEIEAVAPEGWSFQGWSGDIAETQNPLELTMTNDLDVYALFLPTDGRSIIDVWYGDTQWFGDVGVPQAQINILGNVIISEQISAISFSVNGGSFDPISMGPEDNIRLGRPGDFNIEIPYTDLNEGSNVVTIKAISFDGTEYMHDITVNSTIYNVWPRPFAIDWSQVTRIDEVGQVVDGKWELVPGGVKAVEAHYDRVIAIGDIEWTDFEVTVPITVHKVFRQPPPYEPLVGIMLRWDGHETTGFEQPGTEWRPIGAMGVHGWYTEGSRGGDHFQIFETGSVKFGGYPGISLPLETTYYFKFRVETIPDEEGGFYSFKVWPAGQPEPLAWGITRQTVGGLRQGSVMLVAQYVEATFGNVIITSFDPNTNPTISITGPAVDGYYVDAVPTEFTATANDAEDGDISSLIRWSSDIDGPLDGIGASVFAGLSKGEHTITASIVDSDSGPAVDHIQISVAENTVPSVSISSPVDGSTSLDGVPLSFTAAATDPYDGDISDSILWSSSLDGPIQGAGPSLTTSGLSLGTHVITATATDRGSLNSIDTIVVTIAPNSNAAPIVSAKPSNEQYIYTEGDQIDFVGFAIDSEDGDLTHLLTWSSDLDGAIPGTGANVSASTLSVGTHQISAKATDSGLLSTYGTVSVTVNANVKPLVAISSPAKRSSSVLGETINFVGSAFDPEDGNLTSSLTWTSSLDGVLAGTGSSFSTASLSPGAHTITASVQDSRNVVGSKSIDITVNTPSGPIVSDDFITDTLDTNLWTFVDPVGDSAFKVERGLLSITLPAESDHDIWLGGNRSARAMQRIDDTDFGFLAKFGSMPTKQFQNQGILIESDASNFVRYDIYSNGKAVYIFAANFSNNVPDMLFNKLIGNSSAYFMRVNRLENNFSLEYSLNGLDWIVAGVLSREFEVVQIGVYAGNASGVSSPGFTAEIDHVFNTDSPILIEDDGGPNSAPLVSITAPATGITYTRGESISLSALAEDVESGDLSSTIVWSSSIDGVIGATGASTIAAGLSEGTHSITATVIDPGGATGSASIMVIIDPNKPPVVSIASPSDKSTFRVGESVTFSGAAADALDGDLSQSITWVSSKDGAIGGTGATFSTAALTIGIHQITATAIDSNLESGSATIQVVSSQPSTTPSLTISSPSASAEYTEGDVIGLIASASDVEDGDLSNAIIWHSSIDGPLSSVGGNTSVSTLSVGTHEITAEVYDSGFVSQSQTVTIVVNENKLPVVTISTPAEGARYTLGDTVAFLGSVVDPEDGDLTGTLTWSSNIDGVLDGVGASISTSSLSAGRHVISATAADSRNMPGTSSVNIVINTPRGPIVSDDFTIGALDKNLWTFVDPVGDSAYQFADGVLEISVPAGSEHDIWLGGNQSARVVQRVDNTDFGTQAKFGSVPTKQFQNQGILIEQDAENFIRFDFYSNGSSLQIFGASFVNGQPSILFNRPVSKSPTLYLKVERQGDLFTLSYSADGAVWSSAGSLNRVLEVIQVGLYAGNSANTKSPAFTASIDYFFNVASPISPEDGGGPNGAPIISVIAPLEGAVYNEGETIDFGAIAMDGEDGDLSSAISWISSIDGVIAANTGVASSSYLSVGTHSVAVSASDSSGAVGTTTFSVTVNAQPSVTIKSPIENATFSESESIDLTAVASDAEDGNITNSITWMSNVDGLITGTGGEISTSSLSIGTHVISASVTDSSAWSSSDSTTVNITQNTEPVITISDLAGGATFAQGQVVSLQAFATDNEDGDIAATVEWSSNLDGSIGNPGGTLETSSLSAGTHVITATAMDAGTLSSSASITIIVTSNDIPFVLITGPEEGSTYTLGDSIQFVGSAVDTEDGELTPGITWILDSDGSVLGTGGAVSISTLPAGIHTITAAATDVHNVAGLDSITISILTPKGPLVSDDFVGAALNTDLWTFVDPVGDSSHVIEGGKLSINVPKSSDHDIWTSGNRSARAMQRVDDADFGVEVKFTSTPNKAFQYQGIIVETNDINFLRFDVYSNGISVFVFGASFAENEPEQLFNTPISLVSNYMLRLSRVGDFFTFEYSLNEGATWLLAGSISRVMEVKEVGVYAGNASGSVSPEFTVTLDHFMNTAAPIVPQD